MAYSIHAYPPSYSVTLVQGVKDSLERKPFWICSSRVDLIDIEEDKLSSSDDTFADPKEDDDAGI